MSSGQVHASLEMMFGVKASRGFKSSTTAPTKTRRIRLGRFSMLDCSGVVLAGALVGVCAGYFASFIGCVPLPGAPVLADSRIG